jgi:hypothetical protein
MVLRGGEDCCQPLPSPPSQVEIGSGGLVRRGWNRLCQELGAPLYPTVMCPLVPKSMRSSLTWTPKDMPPLNGTVEPPRFQTPSSPKHRQSEAERLPLTGVALPTHRFPRCTLTLRVFHRQQTPRLHHLSPPHHLFLVMVPRICNLNPQKVPNNLSCFRLILKKKKKKRMIIQLSWFSL